MPNPITTATTDITGLVKNAKAMPMADTTPLINVRAAVSPVKPIKAPTA